MIPDLFGSMRSLSRPSTVSTSLMLASIERCNGREVYPLFGLYSDSYIFPCSGVGRDIPRPFVY